MAFLKNNTWVFLTNFNLTSGVRNFGTILTCSKTDYYTGICYMDFWVWEAFKKIKSINEVNVLICLDPLPPPNKEKKN